MRHIIKIITLFLFLAVATVQAGYAYSDTTIVHIDTTVCGQLKWNDTLLLESGDYGYLYTDGDAIFVDSLHLTVNPLPTPGIIGETIVCDGQTTTLTATGGIQYQWSSAVSSDTNASITVGRGGYTVTVTDANGCSNIASVRVNILPQFSAGRIMSGDTTLCEGDTGTVLIGDSVSASGGDRNISYRWKRNNMVISGTEDTLTVPVDALPVGTYMFTREAKDSTCNTGWSVSDGQYTITIEALPDVHIVASANPICAGENSTLIATGGHSYLWSSSNDTTQQIVVVGDITKTYTVTATSSNYCSATASFTLTVNPLPTVTISGSSTFCEGTFDTLTASGANSYVWSNGETSDTLIIANAGTYTVTGKTVYECISMDSITVSILPKQYTSIDTSICQDQAYDFFGQTLSTTGVYTHTLQTVNGCDSVITLTLIVKPLPTPHITGPTQICEGETATLTAVGGNTYHWSNGSMQNSISVSQNGTYTVTATSAENCSATADFTLTVNSLPNVSIDGVNQFCQDTSTVLTASGASTYVWSNGATGSTNIVNTAGTYTVTGTDANGCTNTDSIVVSTDTLPNIVISGNTSFCADSSTTLTASGADAYKWNTGSVVADITVNTANTYTVTGTDGNNCQGRATVTTVVLPLPTPVITGDTVICSYDTTILIAGGGVEYVWSTGDISNQIQVADAGTYSVMVTDSYGCSASTVASVSYESSDLETLLITCKKRNGTPYMLVYPQAGLLYQWYKDGKAIPNATKQYYAPEAGLQTDGNTCYKVHVRESDPDKCGVLSECWDSDLSMKPEVRILPNPNNGQFRLMLPEGTVSVQILNANGKTVLVHKTDGVEMVEMNTGFANGLYIVKTFRKDGSFDTEKIIINR